MAYIKADHSKLKSTASAVETYAELLEREIKTAKQDVQTLYADWQGADASQFQEKFNGITGTDSAHFATVKALKSYAEYLRFAADTYQKAQERAVNRAVGLPKF